MISRIFSVSEKLDPHGHVPAEPHYGRWGVVRAFSSPVLKFGLFVLALLSLHDERRTHAVSYQENRLNSLEQKTIFSSLFGEDDITNISYIY
jgi:hypothetical protein